MNAGKLEREIRAARWSTGRQARGTEREGCRTRMQTQGLEGERPGYEREHREMSRRDKRRWE